MWKVSSILSHLDTAKHWTAQTEQTKYLRCIPIVQDGKPSESSLERVRWLPLVLTWCWILEDQRNQISSLGFCRFGSLQIQYPDDNHAFMLIRSQSMSQMRTEQQHASCARFYNDHATSLLQNSVGKPHHDQVEATGFSHINLATNPENLDSEEDESSSWKFVHQSWKTSKRQLVFSEELTRALHIEQYHCIIFDVEMAHTRLIWYTQEALTLAFILRPRGCTFCYCWFDMNSDNQMKMYEADGPWKHRLT